MSRTYVVQTTGDDTNGGGYDDTHSLIWGSSWHNGSFGPIRSMSSNAIYRESATGYVEIDYSSSTGTGTPAVGTLVRLTLPGLTLDDTFVITAVDSVNETFTIDEALDGSGTWSEPDAEANYNIGGALLNPQSAVTLWTEGMILLGPGTHVITDATKIDMTGKTTDYNNWLRIHACDASGNINPATKPKLDAQGTFAASCAMINLAGADYTMVTGLELDGNDITNLSYGIWDGNSATTDCIIDKVEVHHCKSHGIYGQSGSSTFCMATVIATHDNGGYGLLLNAQYGSFFNINTYNNGSYGFYAGGAGSAVNITGYDNVYGLYLNAARQRFINCISSGSTNAAAAGFQVMGTGTASANYHAVFKNCVSMGNPYGFKLGAILDSRLNGVYMDGCIAYNNTYGDEYWASKADSAAYIRESDYVTGTELVTNGGFTAVTGDNPTGWTVVGTENATHVIDASSGACVITSEDTTSIGIYQNITGMEIGQYYALEFDLTISSGITPIFAFGTSLDYFQAFSSSGKIALIWKCSSATTKVIGFRTATTGAASFSVDNVSAKEISQDAFFSHYLGGNNRVTEPPFVDAANDDYRVDMTHANAALLYNSTTGVLDGPLGPEITAGGGGISTSRILGGI